MKQEKISALQLFYVIVGFEVGNTLIFPLGAGAKQDAWLTLVVGMIIGLVLMFVYTKLSAYYPGDTLVQMTPKIIGKYLAFPINLMYILYFVFLATTASRNFGELIVTTILVDTPIVVVIGSFMVLVIYCLRGGVETFGRMGEVIFPIYLFALIVVWVLLLSVENFTINNLTPVLGNGVKPIVKEAFPHNTIPFGETIIILMFFPVLNKKQNARKTGMAVIIIGGILLTFNTIMNLSVLGPEIYGNVNFPLLSATRQVSIADFLERFDALIILLIVSGVFFKVGGWTYGAAVGIAQLFNLKDYRSILLALGTIIPPLSLLHASNYVEHILEVGREFINVYLDIPLQIIIPLLLLFIAFIRNKLKTWKSS
ncbi:MAG: GerAB/ArcD/ProY family transporter [Bacillota bacterium]